MPFKHGRLGELWLNGVDVSGYFASADFQAKVDTAETTAFKNQWKTFIPGESHAQVSANGFYDSADADKVRDTLQVATGAVLSYFPAGAVAIGDQARLLAVNSVTYKNGSKIGGAVTMDWSADSTAVVGIGTCLHILQAENVGTITGTGDGLLTSAQSLTGAVATLHVTAMTGGDTHSFKLQDATTLGGTYTDIASGAFTNVTAVGAQRLVIPGTIRQFVRAVATIVGHAATYGIAVART